MAPKYQFIADSLRSEIENGQYSSKQLLPTEQLLCQRFQISRQTIRRALSVLEEEGLITRRQGSGSHLRERTEKTAPLNCAVAVVTTYINDYIFPNILQGMETVLTANSSAPLLFATQNQISTERKILQTLLTMKPLDGVLVEGSKTALPCPNLDLYRKLLDRGVRLVFINGCYPELSSIPSVLADNYGGGRMLVEYLSQKGHQHIAASLKMTTCRARCAAPATWRPSGTWACPLRTNRSCGTTRRAGSPSARRPLWTLCWMGSETARPLCATTTR